MFAAFHQGNRQRLYRQLPEDSLLIICAGSQLRWSADSTYPFVADRNFLYLTGCDRQQYILLAEKKNGEISEKLFITPPNPHHERWNGKRLTPQQAIAASGIENIDYVENFSPYLRNGADSGRWRSVWFALDQRHGDTESEAARLARGLAVDYPSLPQADALPLLRRLRTFKQPCEIAAMRRAMEITGEGILRMMQHCRPGMYEYQLKAEFDYVLQQHNALAPLFPPIISAGLNNFCIHYYDYNGLINDGDMVLNDVGACWDGMYNDVSRGWPANGKFSPRQRALYECAYATSEHMFNLIKPGMPMPGVDAAAQDFLTPLLIDLGLIASPAERSKIIWHGGAHHVGYDVHDVVDREQPVQAGMVFCVDIGLYCEEWGIGFRVEDNCLVTTDGCENLSAAIPRKHSDIEAALSR